MWIGIILLAYCVGTGLLIRFFQSVHQWDNQIEIMENKGKSNGTN